MLILTRNVGESLMIGDDVSVILLGFRGAQAKIGINAPKNVEVHRLEIYKKNQINALQKEIKQLENLQEVLRNVAVG